MTKSYKELAKECWTKEAEKRKKSENWGLAAIAFNKIDEKDEASYCFHKLADKSEKNMIWSEAAWAYKELADHDKYIYFSIKYAEHLRYYGLFEAAAKCFKIIGEKQREKECLSKHVKECVKNKQWARAAEAYDRLHELEEKIK